MTASTLEAILDRNRLRQRTTRWYGQWWSNVWAITKLATSAVTHRREGGARVTRNGIVGWGVETRVNGAGR